MQLPLSLLMSACYMFVLNSLVDDLKLGTPKVCMHGALFVK